MTGCSVICTAPGGQLAEALARSPGASRSRSARWSRPWPENLDVPARPPPRRRARDARDGGGFVAPPARRATLRSLSSGAPLLARAGGALSAGPGAGAGESLVPRARAPQRRCAGRAAARGHSARRRATRRRPARAQRAQHRGGSRSTSPSRGTVAPRPLVVALHGGTGHGRDFIWSWLREAARARSPAVADVAGPHVVDHGRGTSMPRCCATSWPASGERYPLDRTRVLLTGMSDGAPTRWCAACRTTCRSRTWRRPAACCTWGYFGGGLERARDRPIYLIHGALDWMFPVTRPAWPRRR